MSTEIVCANTENSYTEPQCIVKSFLNHESNLKLTTSGPTNIASARKRGKVANTIHKVGRTRTRCQLRAALQLSAAMSHTPPTPPLGGDGLEHQWRCASLRYDAQRQNFAMQHSLKREDKVDFDVDATEARSWILTCGEKLQMHPWVIHTAFVIFDHFSRIDNVRVDRLLVVAGTALFISTKTCGAVTPSPNEFEFPLSTCFPLSTLIGLHKNKKLFSQNILDVMPRKAETVWKEGCDVLAVCKIEDFLVMERHMLHKLGWLVSNKISLFHFVDLLVLATGNCPAVRIESTQLASQHCVETPSYTPGVDPRVIAVQFVSSVLRKLSSVGHGVDEKNLAIICQVSGQSLSSV